MVISMKDRTDGWMSRPRRGNEYWSGVRRANGWCIFTSPRTLGGGYYLGETGLRGGMVETRNGVRTARRFGPFGSFDAAKAAFAVMGDALKKEKQNG